jgi:flagellar hook-associated protein 3 FlgL
MRITSDTLRETFLAALQGTQQQLNRTQQQLATGLRVTRPSDDPLAATRIQGLEAGVSRLEQFQRNAGLLRSRLGLEESVLAQAGDILQRARELAILANNASQSNETRRSIAVELRQGLEALIDIANSQDSAGRHLFAGFQERTQPFVATSGGATYFGDQGQRQLQVADTRTIADTDSGAAIFQLIKNGNGDIVLSADAANAGTGVLGAGSIVDSTLYVPDNYSITFLNATDYEVRDGGGALVVAASLSAELVTFPGVSIELTGTPAAGDVFNVAPSSNQDVFATLNQLIVALEAPVGGPSSQALLNNRVGQSLPALDQALDHLIDRRADVGARLHALDDQDAINADFSLELTRSLSDLRDLDYAEAISRLNQQLFGLEVAQSTFARLQGLSLFRFL